MDLELKAARFLLGNRIKCCICLMPITTLSSSEIETRVFVGKT
jgi:hypothetical protein